MKDYAMGRAGSTNGGGEQAQLIGTPEIGDQLRDIDGYRSEGRGA
jgi:hypothetical protein